MLFASLLTSAAPAVALVARSYGVPANNSFPKPNEEQTQKIALQAGGKLPGAPLPNNLGPDSITAFQLITFNELFETAYFSSLLHNITEGVPGYKAPDKEEMVTVVKTVLAQEELHALAAMAALETSNAFVPSACNYTFPVDNLKDAVNLAETFTAVVLGALQGANTVLSTNSQQGLVQVISSVIGQEGEQNGLYRIFLKRVPSESPFLTYVPAPFAWSALQSFVVPGSCPFELGEINLPIFPGLTVNGEAIAVIEPKDQTLSFSVDLSSAANAAAYVGSENLWLTYTTGQQLPISVNVENVKWKGQTISFNAKFPFKENAMGGFSHAALTTSNQFKSADDIPNYTLAAPGLIQVNQIFKA